MTEEGLFVPIARSYIGMEAHAMTNRKTTATLRTNDLSSLEAEYLARLLAEAGTAQGLIVGGILLPQSSTQSPILFGNVRERGHDLVLFYRMVADMIDQKADDGLLVERDAKRLAN